VNNARQVWLVAAREMRERSRSRAFRASVIVMILVVVGVILLPTLLETRGGTKNIGLTGSVPTELLVAILATDSVRSSQIQGHSYFRRR
jgi:ABC-2 type transport system permease protein